MKREIVYRAREVLERRRRELLGLRREHLEQQARHTDEPAADWVDRGALAEEVARLERLSESELRELRELEAALERLEKGGFGRCQSCGGPISPERLRVQPEARVCIACAELAEERARPLHRHL